MDSAEEVLQDVGIAPVFTAEGVKRLDARVIAGEGYWIACLTSEQQKYRSVFSAVRGNLLRNQS